MAAPAAATLWSLPARAIGNAWGFLQRNLPGLGAVGKEIGKSIPHLENEAVVEVVGQPGASKQQLYFLAMSTAMGLVGRSDFSVILPGTPRFYVNPPPGMIMVEYDAADNWVRATIRYRTSTLGAITETFSAQRFYRETAVYAGPNDSVTGAEFNFTSINPLGPGIPNSAQSSGAPQFPFAGRDVLSSRPGVFDPNPDIELGSANPIPSPNPKPPGDNRSRGVAFVEIDLGNVVASLVPLVFAALSDPGTAALQVFPQPTSGPLGG